MEVDMGKAKRKRKKSQTKTKKFNYTALIIAVILTTLVIFFLRGGFGKLEKSLFESNAKNKTAFISTDFVTSFSAANL
jgi:hypothetical protein